MNCLLATLNTQPCFVAALQTDEWKPIGTAPRDGTIVEVRCTYGVAPWYGLYQWKTVTLTQIGQDGKLIEFHEQQPRWVQVGEENIGFEEGPSFSWRPYRGDVATYADPTGGAQNTDYYWRSAVAVQAGLPPTYFEAEVARKAGTKAQSWWTRFFAWFGW